MSRPLRIEFSGGVYHVTNRGNRRSSIYLGDSDNHMFLEILGDVVDRFGWYCHAYCLMSNHYHLLIETPKGDLSRGMRQLNGVYTQRFNRIRRKVGHVFQGRYKAVVVQKDEHLLELTRYIVLNPVRANMVNSAHQWKWSSYRATVGQSDCPDWLTTDWVLAQFGSRRKAAIAAYKQFVRAGLDESEEAVWSDLAGGLIFGDEGFVQKIMSKIDPEDEKLREVSRSQRLAHRPPLDRIFEARVQAKDDRNRLIAEAYQVHGYSMPEIARHLGIHYATVSRAVKTEGEV